MAARTGYVLYWAGLFIAALLFAAGAAVIIAEGTREIFMLSIFTFVPATAIILLGRAARYILAGD